MPVVIHRRYTAIGICRPSSLSTHWFEASDFQSDIASARTNRVILGIINSPLRAGMIRGTVHLSRKRAVRTGHRQWHVRKHPDTGAARSAAGGHARPQGRGAEGAARERAGGARRTAGSAAGTAFPSCMGCSHATTCTCSCPPPKARHLRSRPQDGRPLLLQGPARVPRNPQAVLGDAGSGAGATSRQPPAPSRADPCFSILTGTSLTLPVPAGSYSRFRPSGPDSMNLRWRSPTGWMAWVIPRDC